MSKRKHSDQDPSWSRSVPLSWSSFKVPPLINNRNIASSFLKSDSQNWQSRASHASGRGNDILSPHLAQHHKRSEQDDASSSDESDEDEEPNDMAQETIVIHPGSEYLHIGRANSLGPLTYPSVIARRAPHLPTEQNVQKDVESQLNGLVPPWNSVAELPTTQTTAANAESSSPLTTPHVPEGESTGQVTETDPDSRGKPIEALRQDLRSIMRMMKLRAVPQGRQLSQAFNESAQPQAIEHDPDEAQSLWTKDSEHDKVFIGEQALRLPHLSLSYQGSAIGTDPTATHAPWRLFRPFQRGMLNLDQYTAYYGEAAEQALLGDVQTMLEMILSAPEEAPGDNPTALTGLGIERKRWSNLTITLIVPDLVPRRHIKLLSHLLLHTMGFAGLILQCEAVASCFGAGVSSGTVINLGAETINIACVDEGILVPESRIAINYGGSDVSRFLAELLHRAKVGSTLSGGSPAPLAYDGRYADRQTIEQVKIRTCTLWPNEMGLHTHDLFLGRSDEKRYKLPFRIYDETLLAPLMLFLPRVVDFDAKSGPRTARRRLPSGEKRLRTHCNLDPVLEDPTDPYAAEPDTATTNAMLFAARHLVPAAVTALTAPTASTAATPSTAPTPSRAPSQAPAVPQEQQDVDTPMVESNTLEATEVSVAETPAPLSTTRATPNPGEGSTPTQALPVSAPAPVTVPTLIPAPSAFQSSGVDVAWEASKSPLDLGVWAALVGAASTLLGGSSVEDRVKKMASNMLCVGGTAHFSGLTAALEARVASHIEAQFHTLAQERETANSNANATGPEASTGISPQVARLTPPTAQAVPTPRDMNPAHVAWKGAAVMSRLDTIVAETRVRRQEWDILNWRAVRERTLFL